MISHLPSILSSLYPDSEFAPKTVEDVLRLPSFLSKMRSYEGAFSQSFDAMLLEVQDALVLKRLQQIINVLFTNRLWRDRLSQFGFSSYPRSFNDWQSLPITDRDTLHHFYMGNREGQVVPLSHGGFEVVASGGTSGGLPIETVYSIKELRDTYALAGLFMDHYIFRKFFPSGIPRWVIMTLADNDMWSSGTMIGGVLQWAESTNFIAAGPMSEVVYRHILSFPGNKAIMGMSREIEPLVELGANVPLADREMFKLAIYGSGLLQSRKVKELETTYPNLQILSYFASNQAEAISMQLNPGGYLTTVPGLHFIEIVDENGRWVEEGEEGELVITRLHANEAPVLRMQLGDRMIRRSNLISSSLCAMQMEFAGRSSDIIHIGESHYQAARVLKCIYGIIKEKGIDLESKAAEIQFFNDRVDRHLILFATVGNPDLVNSGINSILGNQGVRTAFVHSLTQALPLYDQNEFHFEALERTPYTFEICAVSAGSPRIYRTKVNKVPLIKDRV